MASKRTSVVPTAEVVAEEIEQLKEDLKELQKLHRFLVKIEQLRNKNGREPTSDELDAEDEVEVPRRRGRPVDAADAPLPTTMHAED